MKRRVLLLTPLLLACGPYFYQAPPPLENYPQRIPGKNWREIFREAKPAPLDAATSDRIIHECEELAKLLPGMPVEERHQKIDDLLEKNREGDFRLRAANFLIELQEIAADDATLAAAGPYLSWRIQRLPRPAGFVMREPTRTWRMNDQDFLNALAAREKETEDAIRALDKETAAFPELIRPNLQVQKAAMLFERGALEQALQLFNELREKHPEHPRAEPALLMAGRCELELSRKEARKANADPALLATMRARAEDLFESYFKEYPYGRYAADTKGWLAACAVDGGYYPAAILHQIERLDLQPTREVTRSVLRECDLLFAELFKMPEASGNFAVLDRSMPWEKMAARPEIARLFIFQALDPVMRDQLSGHFLFFEDDGNRTDFLHTRIIRPQAFAKKGILSLGDAIARSTAETKAGAADLLVLAWAALQADKAEQALALFDQALEQGKSEELLQGRALVLTRLGRHQEALATYRDLQESFPASPITRASLFEAALARFRSGEAGEAFIDLQALSASRSGDFEPAMFIHGDKELRQWVDAIAQFAPVEQLAAPLSRLPQNDRNAELLRGIIRCRALTAGHFNLARRYLDPAIPAKAEDRVPRYDAPHFAKDERIWSQEIESLAGAMELATDAEKEGRDVTRYHLKIGRAWKALRGRLTLPLQCSFPFSGNETEKQDLNRRKNGALLGIAAKDIERELDYRDELRHALDHFLKAAESKDPEIAAPALEEANEAIVRLAEYSQYAWSRAVESDHAKLSAQLVARLKRDFSNRPEAARAATWNFTPLAELGRWMPGDYRPWGAADMMAACVINRNAQRWDSYEQENESGKEAREIAGTLQEVVRREGTNMAEIRRELTRLRTKFDTVRPKLTEDSLLRIVDDLDDLASVAAVPDLSVELFQRYAELRLGKQQPPASEGEWQVLAPWLAFLDRIRPISQDDYRLRPNNDTEAGWKDYLRQFPDGPKSEAASLRLLRRQVRALCPIPQVEGVEFPDSPVPGGYKRMKRSAGSNAEDLTEVNAAIDDHLRRYPAGRYQADLSLLRAAVAADMRDYPLALENLAAVLSDPAHPELRMNAVLQLADCGARLLDLNERAAVAKAFREKPAAKSYLKNLAFGDTCLFRLRPMMTWLDETE